MYRSKRTLSLLLLGLGLGLSAPAQDSLVDQEAGSDTTQYNTGTTTVTEEGVSTYPADDEAEAYKTDVLTEADRAPVFQRHLPADEAKRLRSDEDYNYADLQPERPSAKPREEKRERSSLPNINPDLLKVVLWTLVGGGILAALLAFLSSMDISLFGKRRTEPLSTGEAPPEEDLFNFDFENAVTTALAAANYRLAIRLRYLQLLRIMAERDIIQYRQERSNGVYVSQLYGTAYHADFFRITRYFEYAWYGQLPVSEHAYTVVQRQIDQLKSRFA